MGEAGFSCPKCAEPMLHAETGLYLCQQCGGCLRLVAPATCGSLAAAVPSGPEEVERWLKCYPAWLETLEGAGYYGVAPDLGTRIQSNRTGRPTERTALLFGMLVAQCRAVELWLAALSGIERRLADWYIAGATVPALCIDSQMSYWQVHAAIRRIPRRIWTEVVGHFRGLDDTDFDVVDDLPHLRPDHAKGERIELVLREWRRSTWFSRE